MTDLSMKTMNNQDEEDDPESEEDYDSEELESEEDIETYEIDSSNEITKIPERVIDNPVDYSLQPFRLKAIKFHPREYVALPIENKIKIATPDGTEEIDSETCLDLSLKKKRSWDDDETSSDVGGSGATKPDSYESSGQHEDTSDEKMPITTNKVPNLKIEIHRASTAGCEDLSIRSKKMKVDYKIATNMSNASANIIVPKPKPRRSVNRKEQLFNCEVCGRTFNRKANLAVHTKIHTGERPHKCDVCEKPFISTSDLRRHRRIHEGKTEKDVSDVSGNANVTVPKSEATGSDACEEELFPCEVCGKTFNRKTNLVVHRKIHTGERPHKCDICEKTFISSSDLRRHRRIHTGDHPYICDICGQKLTQHGSLVNHKIQRHGSKDPYTCNVCGMVFSKYPDLRTHRKDHTEELRRTMSVNRLHKCDQCGKSYTQKASLNTHKKSHTGMRFYICEVCNKSFTTKSDLTRHGRIHTGEKPYVCDVCGVSFRFSCGLQRHRKVHTDGSECEVCGLSFPDLKSHMVTHMDELPFSCSTCGKLFADQDSLDIHEKMHIECPYECDVCGKAFSTDESMNKHRRGHIRKKKYTCDVCEVTFTNHAEYTAHLETHSPVERPFCCDICKMLFAEQDKLEKHMRTHDADIGQPKVIT